MDLATFALLLLAGVGAGFLGYLTGMASIVSYPAMLSAGLSPIAANVSQTLGLVGIGAGAATRSVGILAAGGRQDLVQQLALATVGGGAGATLLLVCGEGAFTLVVPWLIVVASIGVLVSPRLKQLQRGRAPSRRVYLAGLTCVSIYGGYFGAGAGTIYLALALLASSDSFGRSMILKSVLLAATNLVASIVFIAFGPVDWYAALALGVGCVLGGNLGPLVQSLLPERLLRWIVALSGLVLALWLSRS